MSTYFKDEGNVNPNGGENIFSKIWKYYHAVNDKIQYYKQERWLAIGAMGLFFFIRMIFTGGKLIIFII